MFSLSSFRKPCTRSRHRTASRRRLLAERLDQRVVMDAVPLVSIEAPDDVFLGEEFNVQLTFDNADTVAPLETGYGPFIDVVLPARGVDNFASGGGLDGISFVPGSANFLGAALTPEVFTFDASGTIDHPYAVDNTGTPLQVTGAQGDQLLVFRMPFGSFTPDQPISAISFRAILSDEADLGTPLNLRGRAGFQYGNTPLDDFSTDPSILSDGAAAASWSETEAVSPQLVTMEKTYVGPELETATGPNFVRQYTINVDIADGQTLTDFDVTDLLPDNIQFVSIDSITGGGSATTTPSTTTPGGSMVVNFASVTGSTAAVDASITFSYFVPFRDAGAGIIIDPNSGDDVDSLNNVTLLGDWTPTDSRDPAGTNNVSIDTAGPEAEFDAKSIAIQKSVTLTNDVGGGGFSGGDTVTYTLEFQLSDFFGFDDIVISDILGDGLRFDTSVTPTLSVTEQGITSAGNMLSTVVVTDNFGTAGLQDGTQALRFNVSDELVLRNGAGADVVLGGLVPGGGTGGGDPNATTFNQGPTTGTLTFRAIVQDEFDNDFPSGDRSVDENDVLGNTATITGDVLSYIDGTATGQVESDDTAAELVIAAGTLSKGIFAVNNSTTLPSPLEITPGDEITYRITVTLPNSDVEDLRLDDYLPLPVLDATEVTTFDDTNPIPGAGEWRFGPLDTFSSIYVNSIGGGNRPTLVTDANNNVVSFDYGDFDQDPSQSTTIDLLFTVTVSSDPFADGLFLTNQVRRTQESTNGQSTIDDAIVQIRLAEPELNIVKGIVGATNPDGVYSPTTTGPVTFNAPGTAGSRFAGTINSDGLAATPIDSNLNLVDAGDLVTFAVVVENTGSSRRGAFDVSVRDSIPAGFRIPDTGIFPLGANIRVTDGTGATYTPSTLGGGFFDPAGGLVLNDPGPTTDSGDGTDAGALDEFNATSGRNVMIITYDLEVLPTADPNELLVSSATLFNYASVEGGPDFTTNDLTDAASTRVAPLDVAKSITATNQAHTAGSNVAIGEIVTYTSTITVPEGVVDNLVWTDTPDAGLAIVGVTGITVFGVDETGTFTPSIGTGGGNVSINFGSIDNANRDNAVDETIVITYQAVVLNTTANDRTDVLDNSATVTWDRGAGTASATVDGPDVTIVEPVLNVTKTITPATGQAASVFDVTLVLAHTGASDADAFEVTLTDVLPAGLNYYTVNNTVQNSAGVAPTTLSESGGTIAATWNTLVDGASSTITFQVQADASVVAGTTIVNNATSTWTSLPGDVSTAQTVNNSLSTERTGVPGTPANAANDYNDADNDSVTIIAPVVTKTLVSTNQTHTSGSNVAIGEIATYQVVFDVPNGQLPGVSFVDTPDAGLAIVDVISVTSSSVDLTTSQPSFASIGSSAVVATDGLAVTFDFGDLSNTNTDTTVAETVTIVYRAVVLNDAANDRGDILDNTGTLSWNTGSVSVGDGPDLTIVEPALSVTVSDATPATADAGDTVTFTVSLAHTSASDADAFDVNLQQFINSTGNHLQYVPGSVTPTASAGVTGLNINETGGDLDITLTSIPIGETLSFTFDAIIQTTAPASSDLFTDADVTWTSLPGDVSAAQSPVNAVSNERTGAGFSTLGSPDDHQADDDGSVTTSAPQSSKVVVASSRGDTGSGQFDAGVTDLAINEEVTYAITAALPEGTNTLVITDTLPLGIEFVSATVSSVGGNLTVTTPTITPGDRNADTIDDNVVIDFGSIVNSPDGVASTSDQIVVQVVGRVRDIAGNTNSLTLTNNASVNLSGAISASSVDVEVVEPELRLVKTSPNSTIVPGQTETFTLTIDHLGTSAADAYDLVIADLISDPNLTLVPGTVTTTRGTLTSGNDPADTSVGLTLDQLSIGDSIVITFDAIVDPATGGGVTIDNPATLVWDSLAGPGGRVGNDADPEPLVTAAPLVDLAVDITDNRLVTITDTGLVYTVTVTNNGPSTATDVIVSTVIDPNLIPNSVVTTPIGTLTPGQSQTFTISLQTPAAVPAPDIVTSTSTVTANETDTNPANDVDDDQTQIRPGARVSGTSWVDINQNGSVDAGEMLLPGVELLLTGVDEDGNDVSATTVTDALGNYRFDQLRPGNYRVIQRQPTLFVDGLDQIGTGGGVSAGNDAYDIALAAGDDETGYDFTERGLRPELIGKRRLLVSRATVPLSAINVDDFYAMFAPSGGGDFDADLDTDVDDYNLFLDQLGGTFAL